jgi:hypothetical protein
VPVKAAYPDPEEALLEKLDWLREASGSRFAEIETELYCFTAVTDDPELAAANSLYARSFYPGRPSDALQSPQFLFGPVDQLVDLLWERREKFGVATYHLVGEVDVLRDFAPVIEKLRGH